MNYKQKYLKYKLKYLHYKKMGGEGEGKGEPSASALNDEKLSEQQVKFETLDEAIKDGYIAELKTSDTRELIQKIPDLLIIDILKINNPNIEDQIITHIIEIGDGGNIYNFVCEWRKLSTNETELKDKISTVWHEEWFESGHYEEEDFKNFMIIVDIVFDETCLLR